ncbi:DUF4255 domain-containing protein [Paracraurococcus lichenis]|uniref:DUF4255 domain-containing protein n=1 Tax=Paracraurococcus lichenis TaxID=3064888 RepID=A0ABT9E9R6_9PROT|nr:DUF4255 domain-containing protein [Paracraurococcus sp. LOR1-02]MDO9712909.1 DUF4255 domain-containing protein [Paracraurococcus sp. LOR1-02]
MFTWIHGASVSLQQFLAGRLADGPPTLADRFGAGGTARVSLHTPQEMAEIPEEGLSLWLYRIVRDEFQLNRPPTRIAPDRLRRAPLPVRLHYLLTPIVTTGNGVGAPEVEQLVIGKVLETFHDQPMLSGAALAGDLAGSGIELTVRLETLTLDEITRVWDAVESSYQLSLSYEVSLVPIFATGEVATGAPVTVIEPQIGLASELRA